MSEESKRPDHKTTGQGVDAMQCQSTMQTIAQGNEAAPGWEAAAAHLAECPVCQDAFRKGDLVDQQLAALTRDVPTPAGLEDRIISAIGESTKRSTEADGEARSGLPTTAPAYPATVSRIPRRRILVATAAAACSVLVAFSYFYWVDSQRVTVEQLKVATQSLPDRQNLPFFAGFPRGIALQPPQGIRSDIALGGVTPKQLKIGQHAVAAYFFSFESDHQVVVKACLLAIPRQAIVDPPNRDGFQEVDYKYQCPVTVWSEGDLVYICCLTEGGGEEILERLFPQEPVT